MKNWIYIFLLSNLSVVAQKADSLSRELKNTKTDTSKVNLLLATGRAFWLEGNDSLGRIYCNQAVKLAQKVVFPYGEAMARLQLVRIEFDYLTDLPTAHKHLDRVMEIGIKTNNKTVQGFSFLKRAQLYDGNIDHNKEIKVLLEKALALFIEDKNKVWEAHVYAENALSEALEGKFAEAIELMLKARKMQEDAKDLNALRSTIPNLGTFYLNIKKYDAALKCYEDAENIAVKLNDVRSRAYIIGQRGEILLLQNKFQEALLAHQESAKIQEKIKATQWLPRSYSRLSRVYIALKNYDKALYYNNLSHSLYMNEFVESESMDHITQANYAQIYYAQKKYYKSISYANEGLKWANSVSPPLRREIKDYQHLLAQSFEALGQTQKALFHYKQFKSSSDSILNEESSQKVTVATMNYDFEKKQQIDKLQIKTLENDKLTQTRNILAGLSIIGLFLTAFILWSNRRLKNRNQQLSTKNKEIEEALFRGQNIERKRVASELHDNLNTKVAALRWRMEAMDTEKWSESDQKIHTSVIDMIGDVYADIRLISHSMLPPELELQGLVSAIKLLISKLNYNTKLKFNLMTTIQNERFEKQKEYELYNIVLELINNILKHSKATESWVSLSIENQQITVTVSDNGVGIKANKLTDGVGLTNIQARIEAISGKINIESSETNGTKIQMVVPL